jgi:hypothetical protein
VPLTRIHAALAIVLVFGTASCGFVRGDRIESGDNVKRQLERATGINLASVPSPWVGNLSNIVVTYSGGNERESLLVIVFDSARSAERPLGRRPAADKDVVAIKRENVVVLYAGERGVGNERAQIARALGRARLSG